MRSNHTSRTRDPLGRFSRRGFLKGAAALAVARPAFAGTQGQSTRRPIFAYVGAYSGRQGPVGSKSKEQGIYLFEMNPATGVLTRRGHFAEDSQAAWLEFDSSGKHMYAANIIEDFEGTKSGSVSAFTVDRSNGHLELINTVNSEGASPAHVSVHPSGKFLLVANFGGGSVSVLNIGPKGELGHASDIKEDVGSVGPIHPTSAPAGNFAIFGHDHGAHPHMIVSDPTGRFVLVNDLALDKIFVWKFDAGKGALTANDPPWVALPPGDGPRHSVFQAHGTRVYSLQEQGSTIVLFDFDPASGKLKAKQTISALPKGFKGTSFTSGIVISSDGRFMYVTNRLHDSVGIFSIGKSGELAWVNEVWTRGDYPRALEIDPTGNFVYVCNQRSDALTAYRVDRETGHLNFTGQYTPVGTPSIITFLR